MAMPAKSAALHALHGTTSQAKSAAESYVAGGRPKFPRGITREQKQTFKRIVALLEERRTVTPADAELIYHYAVLTDMWQQAMKEISEQGVICSYERTDNSGKVFTSRKKNEACPVADSCSRQMFAILRELGLTPKSRDAVKPASTSLTEQVVLPGSMAAIFGTDLAGLRLAAPEKKIVPIPAPAEFEEE